MKKIIISILLIIVFPFFSFAQLDLYLSGVSEVKKGNYSNAVDELSKVIANNAFYNGRAFLYRGISYYNLNNYNKAIDDLMKAHEMNTSEAALWISKTYSLKNDSKNAVRFLNDYLISNPYCNIYELTSDDAYMPIHKSEEWTFFTDNLQETSIQEIVNTTRFYLEQKKPEQAEKAIIPLNSNSEEQPIYHSLRSKIYLLEGNTPLALAEIKMAVETEPENDEFKLQYANLLLLNGSYQKSIDLLNKLINDKPEDFYLYKTLSEAYYMNDDFEEAKNNIGKYVKYIGIDTSSAYFMAKTDFRLGNFISTLKQINTLIENNSSKPEWLLLRGKTYYETQTYQHANEDLSNYLDLIPNNAEANYYLGLSHLNSGDTSLSCYYLERAVRYGYVSAIELFNEHCQK